MDGWEPLRIDLGIYCVVGGQSWLCEGGNVYAGLLARQGLFGSGKEYVEFFPIFHAPACCVCWDIRCIIVINGLS